jgi:RNA polymerase sigma-70 factor (ECF subfamily)
VEDHIRAAQAGDEEAFRQIVLATQARLRGYLSAFGLSAADVDDLAQEAYVRAFGKLGGFNPVDDFWPFLRTIAQGVARNAWRTESRRCQVIKDGLGEAVAEDALKATDAAPAGDDRTMAALEECLKRLPENSRRVVHCRYWRNMSPQEIAETMGGSASTVRVWLLRAREALHRCVAGQLHGGFDHAG